MLYLLDANVLIRAHEDYYPLDRIPGFWDWLAEQAKQGRIKMPFEIHDEIAIARGPLKEWIVQEDIKSALILDEEVDSDVFNRVINEGYAPDLTDSELEEAGRDPFLAAYALMGAGRTIVTREISKTSQTRGRRRLPDVCNGFAIPWMNDFALWRTLDFRIGK